MPALDDVLIQRVKKLETEHLKRSLAETSRADFPEIERDGKRLISFSCNDYLGLSQHAQVRQVARQAINAQGVGVGASRLVTGNDGMYQKLETTLANYKETEAALVFGSGYLANIGTISALMDKEDIILTDKLSHACILDGVKLSGAAHKRFAHNDMTHLEQLLEKHRGEHRHCLIITETVFSMDGDLAPLADIKALAEKYDAWVMTDDAHGLGIVKSEGVDIQMGTLSKAAGCYGGYVCGSKVLIEMLINSARSLIFTTGLPPATLAAATRSIELMKSPKLSERVLSKTRLFTSLLGLPEAQSAIVPVFLGDAELALHASEQLAEEGFWVSAIRPPTVPPNTARLRCTFSALHSRVDIQRLAESILAHGWITHTDDIRMDAAV